jgi:protein SCO1/2
MTPNAAKRIKQASVLCLLGVFIGTGTAWRQQEAHMDRQAATFAEIEPAADAADTVSTEPAAAVADNGVTGAFSLTDQNGKAVTEKDYAGYKLVFFGYTHCPDVCPATLQKISQALKALPADQAAKVQPLFITTDPARDTPEILKAYTGIYSDRIVGLTGTEDQIRQAESAYKVYSAKAGMPETPGHADHMDMDHMDKGGGAHADSVYNVDHSSFVYLMGPDNQLVNIFHAEDTPQAMADQLGKALAQK